MNLQVYQYILIAAFIFSIITRHLSEPQYFKYFLFASIIFEIVLGKIAKYYFHTNIVCLNIYVVLCVLFYLFSFNKGVKKQYLYILIIIFCFGVIYDINSDGIGKILNVGYTIGMILVIVSIFNYLYFLVIKNNYISLIKIPLFWMGVGILLFYCSLFPLILFANRLQAFDFQLSIRLFNIVSIGNIFLALGYLVTIACQMNQGK